MTPSEASLRRELRNVGLTSDAIDAVWPAWWSSEAEGSVSAQAELRYTIARRLGISPRSLFDGPPRFVWRDAGRFKNLGSATDLEQSILTSYSVAVGRSLIDGVPPAETASSPDPLVLRDAMLATSAFVQLRQLLALCWGMGIPVIQATVLPLPRKRMYAVTVSRGSRYAILLALSTPHPARAAFILAHEIGHILRGHLRDDPVLLEMADPLQTSDPDDEEAAADSFALALLTGQGSFEARANYANYNSHQVAEAVVREGANLRIDPGVLALCLAYSTGRWPQSVAALEIVEGQKLDSSDELSTFINEAARRQIDWTRLSRDQAEYLRNVMSLE